MQIGKCDILRFWYRWSISRLVTPYRPTIHRFWNILRGAIFYIFTVCKVCIYFIHSEVFVGQKEVFGTQKSFLPPRLQTHKTGLTLQKKKNLYSLAFREKKLYICKISGGVYISQVYGFRYCAKQRR